MAIEEYIVGQPVIFRERVYSDSTLEDLIDPDDIQLTIKPPTQDALVFTYLGSEVTREEEGVYAVEHVVDEEGDWPYRWESTNPATATQGLITVYENNVD